MRKCQILSVFSELCYFKLILDLDLPGTGMSFSDLDQANLSSRRKTMEMPRVMIDIEGRLF